MKEPYIDQIRMGKLKRYLLKSENNCKRNMIQSPLIKRKAQGKVWINQMGIINDDGIDERPIRRDKALFAYSKQNYDHFQQLKSGQMGEHLIICHLDEYNTFIGDLYKVGDALIQVSQPRMPCWRVAFHVGDFNFSKKVIKSLRTGWHFRVMKEGFINTNDTLQLVERPYPEWSVAICNELLYGENPSLKLLYEITKCHLLPKRWITLFEQKLNGRNINLNKRLFGPLKAT